MATTTAPTLPALEVSKSDDPRVVEEAATEDYSLHVVPRTWRMDKVKLTMAWYAVMTAFFYMYFAAFIALAYGTTNALIGIGLTVIAYSLINTVITRVAATSGLTVALFSRSMFGFVGAAIATLIFAATATYYLVFEGSVIAVAAQTYIGGPLKLWYAIVIALTAPLVWRGVRTWLDRLNGFLLPFYALTLAGVVIWALSSKGYHGFLPGTKAAPGTTLPWAAGVLRLHGRLDPDDVHDGLRPSGAPRGRALPHGDHVRLAVLPADVRDQRPAGHPAGVDLRHHVRAARRSG
ncbi:MAG TPA: hypothetical protein VK510_22845, partial [Solirubrobacteraceae bacterium]|nr:hypothetical protein [Solirubrobacteraceae bacterium]